MSGSPVTWTPKPPFDGIGAELFKESLVKMRVSRLTGCALTLGVRFAAGRCPTPPSVRPKYTTLPLIDNQMTRVTQRPAVRKVHRRSRRQGFTLLELLLVLAILVVIGGIVGTNLIGASAEANSKATETQLNMLKNSIQMYQIRMNSLPQTIEELRDGPSDASKQSKWVAPIITEIPKDAWGNDIQYTVNGNSYELRSPGIDGQKSTEDDVVVTG